MGKKVLEKRKSMSHDWGAWELEYSPIWHIRGNEIIPSSFCLKWWQNLAEKQYGDRQMWLEIAHQLGYATKAICPKSRSITYKPFEFEYDRSYIRKSLGLPQNGPLVFRETLGNSQPYHQLWDRLLK